MSLPAATCAHCGAELPAAARFCPACGRAQVTTGMPAPPVAERRLTSVLFADLVGFTTFSEGLDPEDAREFLSAYFAGCRTVVSRYGGTVEKFIGDAVMAVWGVPVAHEDDAERAVRAGLELVHVVSGLGQDSAWRTVAIRVGIVTGEVAVTVGATAEGMVAGDVVNTASRVQSLAQPGRVWVDDVTRSLTSAAIAYEDCGEHRLKGKADPVHLHCARAVVAEVGGGQRVDGLEAPLVGRDRELRVLKHAFHEVEALRRPAVVIVEGEPGTGKSRLAWEFEKYIDGLATRVWWHQGRCLPYRDGVPLWALAEAIRSRLGLVETDAGPVVAERLDAALVQFVADDDERTWLRPRLGVLVGTGASGPFERLDLFSAWTTFLERLGGAGEPVVLVLNDAHHADEGLLDFVEYVLASARAGILVLTLSRPELLARRPRIADGRATVIHLSRLEDDAMAELVEGLVQGLPASTRDDLVRRANGVPLFAVETVRALLDRGSVELRDGRMVSADPAAIDLESLGAPTSLHSLIAARLDALDARERRVVADASVLGESFTPAALAALHDGSWDLTETLDALVRKEILTLETDPTSSERGQYVFMHSVVRQVAYGAQARRDRKARHLAAAGFLDRQPDDADERALVTAEHLIRAIDASSPADDDVPSLTARARDLLVRAAARASALGAPGEAQRLLEAALRRTTDPETRAGLDSEVARVACDAGNYAVALIHAREAAARFDELGMPVEAGEATCNAARAQIISQDSGAAIRLLEPRWHALQSVDGSDVALLHIVNMLAAAYFERGELERFAEFSERRLLLAEAVGDPDALALSHVQEGLRYALIGAPTTAVAMYEGAARIARQAQLPHRLAMALNNLATVQISRDLPAALEFSREAIEAARRSGVRGQIDYTTFNYLLALWTAGDLVPARALLREARADAVEPGIILGLDIMAIWLTSAVGERPEHVHPPEESDHASDIAWLDNLHVMQALADGDPRRAARLAEESLPRVLAAGGLEDDFMHLWPPLVDAALAAGDPDLADRLMAPVSDAPNGSISRAVRAHRECLRARIAAARRVDPVIVEAHFASGLAQLHDYGAVGLHARAQTHFGAWLREQGRGDEADVVLAAGCATLERIGAHGWLPDVRRPTAP